MSVVWVQWADHHFVVTGLHIRDKSAKVLSSSWSQGMEFGIFALLCFAKYQPLRNL
jgi:hypothetical protein